MLVYYTKGFISYPNTSFSRFTLFGALDVSELERLNLESHNFCPRFRGNWFGKANSRVIGWEKWKHYCCLKKRYLAKAFRRAPGPVTGVMADAFFNATSMGSPDLIN